MLLLHLKNPRILRKSAATRVARQGVPAHVCNYGARKCWALSSFVSWGTRRNKISPEISGHFPWQLSRTVSGEDFTGALLHNLQRWHGPWPSNPWSFGGRRFIRGAGFAEKEVKQKKIKFSGGELPVSQVSICEHPRKSCDNALDAKLLAICNSQLEPSKATTNRQQSKDRIVSLSLGTLPPKSRSATSVFQTVFFRFLTSACNRGKPFQRDEECLKTPVFSSILVPSAVTDPHRPPNAPLRKTPFRKHRLLLLGQKTTGKKRERRSWQRERPKKREKVIKKEMSDLPLLPPPLWHIQRFALSVNENKILPDATPCGQDVKKNTVREEKAEGTRQNMRKQKNIETGMLVKHSLTSMLCCVFFKKTGKKWLSTAECAQMVMRQPKDDQIKIKELEEPIWHLSCCKFVILQVPASSS